MNFRIKPPFIGNLPACRGRDKSISGRSGGDLSKAAETHQSILSFKPDWESYEARNSSDTLDTLQRVTWCCAAGKSAMKVSMNDFHANHV
jgi:hypothetical protein